MKTFIIATLLVIFALAGMVGLVYGTGVMGFMPLLVAVALLFMWMVTGS